MALHSCSIICQYLGVMIGPGASDGRVRWGDTLTKYVAQGYEIASYNWSLIPKLKAYNTSAVSLLSYQFQFAPPPKELIRAERRILMKLCAAPWQSMPVSMISQLDTFGIGISAHLIKHVGPACMIRFAHNSPVFRRLVDNWDAHLWHCLLYTSDAADDW